MAHILIADDDDIVASLAADILLDDGHACGWVTSGEDAWNLMTWKRPDLLLLDQDMPGLSGQQLLRRIRQSAKFYDLPVVMFTAVTGAKDEEQALYHGAQDYIRKPFAKEFLIWRVNQALHAQPKHRALEDFLEQNSGRWRDAPPDIRAVI